jgi:hypothetical protein
MSLTVLVTQMTMSANLMTEVADLASREAESGFDIRFHHLPAVELPTESHGTEDIITRFIQLHAPHIKVALSGMSSPVTAVVVDYFCTTLFDVTRAGAAGVRVLHVRGVDARAHAAIAGAGRGDSRGFGGDGRSC